MDHLLTPLTTTTKKGLIYYIIAVICCTAFFVHEFVPVNSQEFIEAVNIHAESKVVRKNARKEVLDSQKGTDLYSRYLSAKSETDRLWEEVTLLKEKESFLGFLSFQHFLGEFGWSFGLLIYSIFNLCISFFRNRKSIIGEVSLHSCLAFISIYFITWALQQYLPDYNKTVYVIYSVLITIFIVLSTHKLLKNKREYLEHLKISIHNFFHFLYRDVDKNDLIRPEKKVVFRKMRVDITNKTVGNE
ncbi:hypothetical protein [Aquimarina aggregata]|uniref:hypothetical protein n=1 Tax=Aquimarina aggregata TaxID=1642818 RepID=UPI002491BFD4|nr:hypothetical protein [Aquimarina aggregata]